MTQWRIWDVTQDRSAAEVDVRHKHAEYKTMSIFTYTGTLRLSAIKYLPMFTNQHRPLTSERGGNTAHVTEHVALIGCSLQ